MDLANQDAPPITWEHLHELSDGDLDFEMELLQLFVEDASHHTEILQQAIAQQDAPQVEQAAHHLKGASANVGAEPMAQAAGELEKYARQNQFEPMGNLTQALQSNLSQIQAYVARQT